MEQIESLKTISKGAGVVFFGLVISKVLTFLYRILIANFYTSTEYGLFSESLAIITLAVTFSLVGLPTAIVRYGAFFNARKNYRGLNGVLISSIKIVVPISLVISACLYIFSGFIADYIFAEQELKPFIEVMSISVPLMTITSVLAYFFVGMKIVKYQVAIQEIFPNLFKLFFVCIFFFLGLGVLGIPLSWTVSLMIVFFLSLLILRKRRLQQIKAKNMIPEMLSFSLPLYISAIFGVLASWTDTIALGIFKSANFVGVYNAALPLAQLIMAVPLSFSMIFNPVMAEYYSKGRFNQVEKINRTVIKWIFMINFGIALPLIIFSRQVLNFLFGIEYTAGWPALIILSVGFLFTTFIYTSSGILGVLKKTRQVMACNITSAAINIILNMVLVPVYGLVGAAIATAITYTFTAAVLIAFVWRSKRMSPFSSSILKSLLAGILSISVTYGAYKLLFAGAGGLFFVLFALVFTVIYGIVLLFARFFSEDDLEIMRALKRKTGLNPVFISRIIRKFI